MCCPLNPTLAAGASFCERREKDKGNDHHNDEASHFFAGKCGGKWKENLFPISFSLIDLKGGRVSCGDQRPNQELEMRRED